MKRMGRISKGKVKEELSARKAKHRILLGVGIRTIQRISRPMSAGNDKQRDDEKRATDPKGPTYDFFRGRHSADSKAISADVGWQG